jgi:hypothetical protein
MPVAGNPSHECASQECQFNEPLRICEGQLNVCRVAHEIESAGPKLNSDNVSKLSGTRYPKTSTALARIGDCCQATILTAWLYQVMRRTAINVVRGESRRQLRQQIALEMANMNSNSSEWTAIEPLWMKP